MTDVRMDFVPFDIGTQVTVYQRKSELMMPDMPPPLVPSFGSAVVQVDKSLTLLNLNPGSYWAIGKIPAAGPTYRYVAFLV